jgi:hypothetical protein
MLTQTKICYFDIMCPVLTDFTTYEYSRIAMHKKLCVCEKCHIYLSSFVGLYCQHFRTKGIYLLLFMQHISMHLSWISWISTVRINDAQIINFRDNFLFVQTNTTCIKPLRTSKSKNGNMLHCI